MERALKSKQVNSLLAIQDEPIFLRVLCGSHCGASPMHVHINTNCICADPGS